MKRDAHRDVTCSAVVTPSNVLPRCAIVWRWWLLQLSLAGQSVKDDRPRKLLRCGTMFVIAFHASITLLIFTFSAANFSNLKKNWNNLSLGSLLLFRVKDVSPCNKYEPNKKLPRRFYNRHPSLPIVVFQTSIRYCNYHRSLPCSRREYRFIRFPFINLRWEDYEINSTS